VTKNYLLPFAFCLLPWSQPAMAQAYPTKPVRIVVGIAPGGGLDTMTRLGAHKLSERWGQSVIVDNRPGGGTVVAMELVVKALPDGYTLLGASDTLMMNGVLKRAAYDVRKAFIPIVQLTTQPYVLVVTPSLPVTSVKDAYGFRGGRAGLRVDQQLRLLRARRDAARDHACNQRDRGAGHERARDDPAAGRGRFRTGAAVHPGGVQGQVRERLPGAGAGHQGGEHQVQLKPVGDAVIEL